MWKYKLSLKDVQLIELYFENCNSQLSASICEEGQQLQVHMCSAAGRQKIVLEMQIMRKSRKNLNVE